MALVTWTFGLLRKALGRRLFKNKEPIGLQPIGTTGQADVVEADGAIGVPRDENQYHNIVKTIQEQKIHRFLSHGAAKYLLLVWLVVCGPIMRLHYFLFDNGIFFSHRTCEDAITVFDFVGNNKSNHLAKAMGALSSVLLDPQG